MKGRPRRPSPGGAIALRNSCCARSWSALLRCALDRAHDALVGPTAADVGAHMLHDLLARWLWIVLEQIGRAHDLPALAVAALRHPLGEPSLLNRMAGIR